MGLDEGVEPCALDLHAPVVAALLEHHQLEAVDGVAGGVGADEGGALLRPLDGVGLPRRVAVAVVDQHETVFAVLRARMRVVGALQRRD